MNSISNFTRQQGYVLITSIIFLVLLTMVALVALKNSGLEARMSANSAYHSQSFEASEISRRLVNTLVDTNVFNRGWPATAAGGSVNDSEFDSTSLGLLTKPYTTCGTTTAPNAYGFCLYPLAGTPNNWYFSNTECSGAYPCSKFPKNLDADAQYRVPLTTGSSSSGGGVQYIAATASIFKLNAALAPGSGAQMNAGYLGAGHGTPGNGSYLYFFINSHGVDLGGAPQAGSDTSTIFRDVIRN